MELLILEMDILEIEIIIDENNFILDFIDVCMLLVLLVIFIFRLFLFL